MPSALDVADTLVVRGLRLQSPGREPHRLAACPLRIGLEHCDFPFLQNAHRHADRLLRQARTPRQVTDGHRVLIEHAENVGARGDS